MLRPTLIMSLLLVAAVVGAAVDFDQEIRPLLQDRCVECHGPKKNKADLRLDAKPHALKGGESGRTAPTAPRCATRAWTTGHISR